MSEVSTGQRQNEPIDEAKVIEFLQSNPEVLMAYPDIFSSLSVPHKTRGAISLVERQLKVLRDQNQSLKTKIGELVSIARENEELNQRFHRLSLELINTDQLHDILALVQDQVQTFFYTDYVCFRFLPGVNGADNLLDGLMLSADNDIIAAVNSWLKMRTPVCASQNEKINTALFGADIHIGSSALIPLYHTSDLGLLCLGSVSPDRFNRAMGTIFLQQLGELVSTRLKNLLQVK